MQALLNSLYLLYLIGGTLVCRLTSSGTSSVGLGMAEHFKNWKDRSVSGAIHSSCVSDPLWNEREDDAGRLLNSL